MVCQSNPRIQLRLYFRLTASFRLLNIRLAFLSGTCLWVSDKGDVLKSGQSANHAANDSTNKIQTTGTRDSFLQSDFDIRYFLVVPSLDRGREFCFLSIHTSGCVGS